MRGLLGLAAAIADGDQLAGEPLEFTLCLPGAALQLGAAPLSLRPLRLEARKLLVEPRRALGLQALQLATPAL